VPLHRSRYSMSPIIGTELTEDRSEPTQEQIPVVYHFEITDN